MLDILSLHNEVFDILLDYGKDLDENLKYRLRKSNRNNKLEDGYWFYGNDDYLVISFWSGSDWKNKTPNIFFGIFKNGRTILEVSVQDSEVKQAFVKKYLVKPLGLQGDGPKYYKEYNPAGEFNYLHTLDEFLNSDKLIIDRVINKHLNESTGKDAIGFVNQKEFDNQLILIHKLRQAKELSDIQLPSKIKSFTIKGYGPIKFVESKEISTKTQFVFLTGLNGTGKSSIIKALAVALSRKELLKDEIHPAQKFEVDLILYDQQGNQYSKTRTQNNDVSPKLKPFVAALAAYGPVRLQTANSDLSKNELAKAFNKSNIIDSLRETDSYLLDIHTHFQHWKQQPKHKKYIRKRKEFIQEILQDFFDSKFRVKITDSGVLYEEIDQEGKKIASIPYNKLSTGLRSTLSLLGDLMIRMYEQQPKILDPAFFEGIVLIDEIDIHLHPVLQKRFVKELAETFPKIQFIITTHSPLPLLGAPKNTAILRVKRSREDGVYLERIEDKMYLTDLLPNTLLTSPIFDMEDIVSDHHEKERLVKTDTSFLDVEFRRLADEKINTFLTDKREQELITLFQNRRKL